MYRYSNTQVLGELSDNEIRGNAPAVFAEVPNIDVSAKYQFIKTITLMNILRENSWYPVKARQQRGDPNGTHTVDFFHKDSNGRFTPIAPNIGDVYSKIQLVNSHNRSRSFSFLGGLWRLWCANGASVQIAGERMATKHIGFALEKAVKALWNVVETIPTIASTIENWRSIIVEPSVRIAYAKAAMVIKHPNVTEEEKNKINAAVLVTPYRNEDKDDNLWNIYNRLQENLTKGGIREFIGGNRARPLTSISKDINLNKALWTLTDELSKVLKPSAS